MTNVSKLTATDADKTRIIKLIEETQSRLFEINIIGKRYVNKVESDLDSTPVQEAKQIRMASTSPFNCCCANACCFVTADGSNTKTDICESATLIMRLN